MYNNNFQTLYATKLKPGLAHLKPKHFWVIITGILTRILNVYFITVVISLFLGFLNMFAKDDFSEATFVRVIMYFMYTVLSFVLLAIVNKNLRTQIGERHPELLKNNALMVTLVITISAIIMFCAYLIGTTYLNVEFGLAFFLRWAGAIASVFFLIFPYNLLKQTETKYIDSFRNIFFSESLPFIHKGINYSEKESLSQAEFEASQLFSFQKIFSYSGSDYFSRDEHQFHGSKLKVMQEETTTKDGKTETKITELFNGYMFIADFNKKFQGETFILPDISRTVLGELSGERLNAFFKRKNTTLVQLEDPDFEKMFAVYSTDAVEARYILSNKLVERITDLKNKFYQDMYISFIDNKIYIAIKSEGALFSPGIFTAVDDEQFLEKQFNYLSYLLTMPEQFDLNTQVWI